MSVGHPRSEVEAGLKTVWIYSMLLDELLHLEDSRIPGSETLLMVYIISIIIIYIYITYIYIYICFFASCWLCLSLHLGAS